MLKRAIFCGCKAHYATMVRIIILKYLNYYSQVASLFCFGI